MFAVETLEPGHERCEHGGTAITYGPESADRETHETVYVCDGAVGAPGRGVVVEVRPVEPGELTCPSGGVELLYGYDDEESTSSVFICDGVGTLLAVSEATPEQCPSGGKVYSYGPDSSGLDSFVVCDGADGDDAALVGFDVQPLDVGDARCPGGGVRVLVGDTSIDPSDWADVAICDGVTQAFDVEVEIEGPSEACPGGGARIRYGDLEGDPRDALVCDGHDDGRDLRLELLSLEPGEPPCEHGGQALLLGLDTTGDGALDRELDRLVLCGDLSCDDGTVPAGEVDPALGPRHFEIRTFNESNGTVWCEVHDPDPPGCTDDPLWPPVCDDSPASYGKQSAYGISNGVQWRIQETGFSLSASLGSSTTNSSTWFNDPLIFDPPDYRDAMHAGGADMTIEFDAVVGDIVFYMRENFCGSRCPVTSSFRFFVDGEARFPEFISGTFLPQGEADCPEGAACPTIPGGAIRIRDVNATSIDLVHGTFDGMTMAWYVESTVPSDSCIPFLICPEGEARR